MADHLRKVQYLKFLRFFFFYKYLLLVGKSSGEAFQGKSGVAGREWDWSKASQHRPETHRP